MVAPAPRARVSSRQSQREATAGAPPRRSERNSTTSGAQAAWAKSCADRPMRRSGGGRPAVLRMGRDRKGSTGAAAGQTPSSRPASTIRSARTSRASMAPSTCRRGWEPAPVRTVSPDSRPSMREEKPDGVTSGRPSASSIRAAIRVAAASPPAPLQSLPVSADRPFPASASMASARARAARGGVAMPWTKGFRAISMIRRRADSRSAASPVSPASASRRSIGVQPSARGPRRPDRSKRAARRARSSGSRPKRAKGCLARASNSTGSNGSTAALAMALARTPTGNPASGAPAEESATTPQRDSRADTRRASAASGVTKAAVLPGVSKASRSSKATAPAASSSWRATTMDRPARPLATGSTPSAAPSALSLAIWPSQSSVASAGRRASLMIRRRQRPSPSPGEGGDHKPTSPRSTPAKASSRFIAPCGCCSPTFRQASSARSWSRPGNTTAPCGASAMAVSRAAAAGAVPVDPAATMTPGGGLSRHRLPSARSRATRRAVTSVRPSSFKRAGQASTAKRRKSAEISQCLAISRSTQPSRDLSGAASSISTLSRKPASASASSRAPAASRLRSSLSDAPLTSRASSNRRRQGEMAGGRSRAMSPGSNGGSPSSRSPSARTCGGSSAFSDPTFRKASTRARAPRRVGVSTTASDRASGPSGDSAA